MLKKLSFFAVLVVLAVGAMPVAHATEAPAGVTKPASAEVRGITPKLLTSIMTWLAANFDLPATPNLPKVEFAPPLKLVAMRYKSFMPESWREDAIRDPSVQAAHQREVVAIYNDRTQTIVLPESWTGANATELSMLVHEMVHHMQNLAKLEYQCPAAREKLAYEAQNDWLKQHGLNLETEFGLDLFTIFVTSACLN